VEGVWTALDEASCVNGHLLVADGGITTRVSLIHSIL
jgi:hypothetical protein